MKKSILTVFTVIALCGICFTSCKPPKKTHNTISAQYEDVINEAKPQKPAEAEIFIDASGSMKPYFSDEEIINAVSKIEGLMTNNTNVYFLGNPPELYKGRIDEIFGRVAQQPGLCATTFHDFFKEQGDRIDSTTTIVYLVTDGIMSIGNGGGTKKALIGLKNRIMASLQGHHNLAAAVLRYLGNYKGTYYNENNKPIQIDQVRPFFIIALGQKPYIEWLKSQKKDALYNPQGELFLGLHDLYGHAKPTVEPNFADNKIDPLQEVVLTLDLPSCLYDISDNVLGRAKISNNGQPLNIPLTRQDNSIYLTIPPLLPGFSADAMGKYNTEIVLPNEVPIEWKNWSVESDLNGPDDSTTFGLIYLINGMFEALESNDNLLEVKFDYSN